MLGEAGISPSTRRMSGPGGSTDVEPRVMQVLVVLADAAGRVVARNTLFQRCWGGVYVGDDSLNRTIGVIRKLAVEIGGGSFRVETVPRTGYRLLVASDGSAPSPDNDLLPEPRHSRRLFMAGGAAAVAAASAGLWWIGGSRTDPRFAALIDRGGVALRYGFGPQYREAVDSFRQAVELKPKNAAAWGLLAYAQLAVSSYASRDDAGKVVEEAERSARTALALDADNADGSLTMVLIQRSLEGRAPMEDAIRKLLAHSPDNPRVLIWLDRLLQGAGRTREAWTLNERRIALETVSADSLMRKALKLWVFGRDAEAQEVSLRTMDLWPSHPLVRNARLMICAFTGRTQEALTLVEEEQARPLLLSAEGVGVWRASLRALETRSPADIATAKDANMRGAAKDPALAAYALLVMSALGEVGTAFEVANGFLLSRGPLVVRRPPEPDKRLWVDGAGWRNTLGLFTPATKAMRLDARFEPLCEGLGLSEYWRQRGRPDAFLFKA